MEDLHQPLHVVSGYYRTTEDSLPRPEIITDSSTALHVVQKNDRGGNLLFFKEEAE